MKSGAWDIVGEAGNGTFKINDARFVLNYKRITTNRDPHVDSGQSATVKTSASVIVRRPLRVGVFKEEVDRGR